MSHFRQDPSNADKEHPLFANKHDNAFEAPGHHRQDIREEFTSKMAGSSIGVATDISAAQKMISATWGSILTSLLGVMFLVPLIPG